MYHYLLPTEYSVCFTGMTTFSGLIKPYAVAIVTLISHRSKMRFREVEKFAWLVTGRTEIETGNH